MPGLQHQQLEVETERRAIRPQRKLRGVQKLWPRAVLVRRARLVPTLWSDQCVPSNCIPPRLFHVSRMTWNSLERKRGDLQDQLIDEVTEWCMWHYATGMFCHYCEGCELTQR